MKIQQIRNATIRIECAGKHFLVCVGIKASQCLR